jgi:hypothetical protein
MPDREHLLKTARNNRDLARRARHMSRFLSQHDDVDRLTAYADELDGQADRMERLAETRDRGRGKGANA